MKALKASVVSSILDISEYHVKFEVLRFLKLFLYHIMFFIFGPLTALFIAIFDTKGIVVNGAFWLTTKLRGAFFLQYFQWMACVAMYAGWYMRETDHSRNWIQGIYFE